MGNQWDENIKGTEFDPLSIQTTTFKMLLLVNIFFISFYNITFTCNEKYLFLKNASDLIKYNE